MIIYASRTGNIRNIVQKLGIKNVQIKDGLLINEPFFVFTYTDGLGSVPKVVEEFMINNYQHCKGVIASGNSNFGKNVFCGSANKINEMYDVPIIHKIELRGFEKDYKYIKEQHNLIIGEG